ncbi:unnamed protein product [Heligmosomoides polygyrus]|uniref:ATP-dependent DNA helicase n=1 Tax=Heligmosomoides polygyrus TaxID=6339 RepID=A0A3P7Z4J4_HELPZ|nr:unnamed protein product [Heligmosomoides polygyrus]
MQVVSQTYRQFCAPVFRRCFAYAWVAAGYVDTHPGHFSTPADYAFDEINNKVLSKLPGQEKIYRSIDEVMNDETEAKNNTEYSLEFLNSLTPQGYPPHELHLKKGAVIMLLRNLRVNQGLCNGTRLTVEHMDRYILGCKIATGANKGQYVLIPRIIFCPPAYDTSPCRFKRRQFPCSWNLDGVPVSDEVHQGSALSPLLFVVFADAITRDLQKPVTWTLLYSDDVMLASEDKDELEREVQAWCDRLERFGLKLNMKKIANSRVPNDERSRVQLNQG